MATKHQRTKGGVNLFNNKKRVIEVTLKMKRIQNKSMINTYYKSEKQQKKSYKQLIKYFIYLLLIYKQFIL